MITSIIQYSLVVDSETSDKTMNEVVVNFSIQILKATHRAHYTQVDIDILDEYRTVANLGMITEKPNGKITEIDISKAYTGAFCKITHIPIFNEFDAFQPYTGQPLEPYTLYIVKTKL